MERGCATSEMVPSQPEGPAARSCPPENTAQCRRMPRGGSLGPSPSTPPGSRSSDRKLSESPPAAAPRNPKDLVELSQFQ